MSELTSLRRTKVLSRSRGTGASATSLLDAQSASFYDFTLQTIFSCISLVGSNHLDEAEPSRLLGMGILHDLALLDLAVFLEEAGDFRLGEAGMNSGNEEVGTRVNGAIFVLAAILVLVTTDDKRC